ncbi:MAG TPA: HPr-rel-A system PqqD family peptide chaperone [Casimicrobiaceae bacterium]|nr:HPr-rel-A system PqqD family peptide chaperone [Casimicrobiaceae bacterium]
MSRDVIWRALDAQAIDSRAWNGESVLYNDVTGSTHQLSVLGSAVMATLLEHPSGIPLTALVRRIADTAGDVADDELRAAVEHTLAALAELRLAASVST